MSEFEKNIPPPMIDPRINKALLAIGGLTPSGLPVLRCIWGQSEEPNGHTWTKFGERAHRYRHHWEKEYAMAEPVCDLTGRMIGYGHLYHYGDVIPATGFLVPVILKKSVGVPRYYFEIGMPIDERDWEDERYDPPIAKGTPPSVIAALLSTGRIRDQWGPPPAGLVEYFPLSLGDLFMRFESHDRRMVKVGLQEFPACCEEKMKAGKRCYGRYRSPTMRDVEMVRVAWAENARQREFFAKPDASRLLWDTESATKEAERADVKRDAQNADDMQQAMTCLSDARLLGEGSGLDLQKYSIASTAKIQEMQNDSTSA